MNELKINNVTFGALLLRQTFDFLKKLFSSGQSPESNFRGGEIFYRVIF